MRIAHFILFLPVLLALALLPGCDKGAVTNKHKKRQASSGDEVEVPRVGVTAAKYGTITGKVVYDGTPPSPQPLQSERALRRRVQRRRRPSPEEGVGEGAFNFVIPGRAPARTRNPASAKESGFRPMAGPGMTNCGPLIRLRRLIVRRNKLWRREFAPQRDEHREQRRPEQEPEQAEALDAPENAEQHPHEGKPRRAADHRRAHEMVGDEHHE